MSPQNAQIMLSRPNLYNFGPKYRILVHQLEELLTELQQLGRPAASCWCPDIVWYQSLMLQRCTSVQNTPNQSSLGSSLSEAGFNIQHILVSITKLRILEIVAVRSQAVNCDTLPLSLTLCWTSSHWGSPNCSWLSLSLQEWIWLGWTLLLSAHSLLLDQPASASSR